MYCLFHVFLFPDIEPYHEAWFQLHDRKSIKTFSLLEIVHPLKLSCFTYTWWFKIGRWSCPVWLRKPRLAVTEVMFTCYSFHLFTTSITFIKTLHECTLPSLSHLFSYPKLYNYRGSVPSCSSIWNHLCKINIISYNLLVKSSVSEDFFFFFVGRGLYYKNSSF